MSALHHFTHFHTSVRVSVIINKLHVELPQICLTANCGRDIWPLTAKTQAGIGVTFCEEIPEDGAPEVWRSPQWNGQPKKKTWHDAGGVNTEALKASPTCCLLLGVFRMHRWTRELLDSCCPSVLVGLWVRCVNARERTAAWWGHDTSKLILCFPMEAETDINLAARSLQGMWVPDRTTPTYKVA